MVKPEHAHNYAQTHTVFFFFFEMNFAENLGWERKWELRASHTIWGFAVCELSIHGWSQILAHQRDMLVCPAWVVVLRCESGRSFPQTQIRFNFADDAQCFIESLTGAFGLGVWGHQHSALENKYRWGHQAQNVKIALFYLCWSPWGPTDDLNIATNPRTTKCTKNRDDKSEYSSTLNEVFNDATVKRAQAAYISNQQDTCLWIKTEL